MGKTTTAAKLAQYYKSRFEAPIILAAADTFRAAAIEQLEYHGKQLDVRVIAHQYGGDPGRLSLMRLRQRGRKEAGLLSPIPPDVSTIRKTLYGNCKRSIELQNQNR